MTAVTELLPGFRPAGQCIRTVPSHSSAHSTMMALYQLVPAGDTASAKICSFVR
jgi:hypothetical protein